MTYPPAAYLATALGVFTDGGVLVAVEHEQTNGTNRSSDLSCWRDIS
jgi:hypothetical protein